MDPLDLADKLVSPLARIFEKVRAKRRARNDVKAAYRELLGSRAPDCARLARSLASAERALGFSDPDLRAAFQVLEAATRHERTGRARASKFAAYTGLLTSSGRQRNFEWLAREIEAGHRRRRPARRKRPS